MISVYSKIKVNIFLLYRYSMPMIQSSMILFFTLIIYSFYIVQGYEYPVVLCIYTSKSLIQHQIFAIMNVLGPYLGTILRVKQKNKLCYKSINLRIGMKSLCMTFFHTTHLIRSHDQLVCSEVFSKDCIK